jgi:pyruvate,water dikinase
MIAVSTETDYEKEVEVMHDGDVLVSGTTGPEMILACQKAGAIITDEGGVMSHAAIVARELKKPCIIGTQYATKVLQDGDLVEVDADAGVVRILS